MPHRGSAPAQLANRKAVGYVRVSTEMQVNEGVSIGTQTDRLQAYCTAAGLDLVRIVQDEAVSGSIPLGERAGGVELLALLDEEGVAHIVALKLDRLFRDAADALNQTRSWDKAGVALHVLDMGGQAVNTASAMGRMFLTMTAAFAELERNLIAERTRAALHHKRSRGEAVGRAPRGLKICGGRLEPDPSSDGLRLVARARHLRQQGLSLARIAERLAADGFRPERGRRFYPSTVRYLLSNPRLNVHADPGRADGGVVGRHQT